MFLAFLFALREDLPYGHDLCASLFMPKLLSSTFLRAREAEKPDFHDDVFNDSVSLFSYSINCVLLTILRIVTFWVYAIPGDAYF
jgi:hypothetical protein